MNLLQKLSLVCAIALTGTSASVFAVDCNSLISKGLQRSVIPVSLGVSLADVNTCLVQCNSIQSTGNPTQDALAAAQCISGLSNLKFAVNYDDSNSGLNPNTFVSAPGIGPNPSFGTQHNSFITPSATSVFGNQPQATVSNVYQTPPKVAPTTPPTGYGSYTINPNAAQKLKDAAKSNSAIRWY